MSLTCEPLTVAGYVDRAFVDGWKSKARIQAINALSLVTPPTAYHVWGVRKSNGNLTGLIACDNGDQSVRIVHLAPRDLDTLTVEMLLFEVVAFAGKRQVKIVAPEKWLEKFFISLGWRHVGAEFWSK